MGIMHKLLKGDTTPDPDDYGTLRSAGAKKARADETNRRYEEEEPSPTVLEAAYGEPTLKKQREAAAEERREGRMEPKGDPTKYAKGGRVTGFKGYGKSKRV